LEGVLAAATVPLFLSLIGNDIISVILNGSQPIPHGTAASPNDAIAATLKLIGFCLIAALYSGAYLEGLWAKVTQLQKDVKKNEQVLRKDISRIDETVEAAVVEHATPKNIKPIAPSQAASSLLPNEQILLKAFKTGKYPIRSVQGLALSSGLTESEILPHLESLEQNGLVRSVDTKHGRRWATTPEGHNVDIK